MSLLVMLFVYLLGWRAVIDMGANVVLWICMDFLYPLASCLLN